MYVCMYIYIYIHTYTCICGIPSLDSRHTVNTIRSCDHISLLYLLIATTYFHVYIYHYSIYCYY